MVHKHEHWKHKDIIKYDTINNLRKKDYIRGILYLEGRKITWILCKL